jgi:hypothetical protein
LSWSELFRAQHCVHKINKQTRAHSKRNNRIEHFPYLNPLQNLTYRTDNAKKTNVEIAKMESSIAASPSGLPARVHPPLEPLIPLPCGYPRHRHFNGFA